MPTYVTPKKNAEYIFYVGLKSQADGNTFQSNPTIASGDFKVSTNGGALANPSTLPAVTPASSKMVKITLSASEMNGDNVTVIASDAAGAEWVDLIVNIQTSTNQMDDLSTQASVNDLPTNAELATALDPLPTAAENATAIWASGTRTLTSFGTLVTDIWALAIETGYTAKQSMRLMLSALAGKLSTSGNTVTIRSATDAKDRITATTTEAGERSAVTHDTTD